MKTLTIEFTAGQATRIATAFKAIMNRENFTMADYKQWVIAMTRDTVAAQEARVAAAALPPVADFDPT